METSASALALLLPGIDPRRFLDEHWCRRPWISHGALERLPRIAGAAALESTRALLSRVTPAVDLRLWSTHKQERFSRPATVREAAAAYRRGRCTLAFNEVDEVLPEVRDLLRDLAADLRTPLANTARCNAYGSPAGATTTMHFDPQDLFFLQIRGRKRWTIAPVHELSDPPVGYYGGPAAPELEALGVCRLPRRMPQGARTVTLRPGSVLYIPRGTWHAAPPLAEASLALTLSFVSMTQADLVLHELHRRLAREPEARRPVGALGAAPGASLVQVVELLRRTAGSLEAADALRLARSLLSRTATDTFMTTTTPGLVIEGEQAFLRKGRRRQPFDVDPSLAPVLRWIAAQRGSFSLRHAPVADRTLARGLCALLVEHGVLLRGAGAA